MNTIPRVVAMIALASVAAFGTAQAAEHPQHHDQVASTKVQSAKNDQAPAPSSDSGNHSAAAYSGFR